MVVGARVAGGEVVVVETGAGLEVEEIEGSVVEAEDWLTSS